MIARNGDGHRSCCKRPVTVVLCSASTRLGSLERLGPDGETTYMETDRAGRVTYVSRGGMSAKYYYYPTGQLRLVRLGNGAFTRYEYDAAQRLLSIQHYAANTSNLLRMDYAYTTRDLIDTITETDDGGAVSVVSFTYDTRSRLLTETRTGEDAYDLTYTYDQGGNRLTKTAVNTEPPFVTETVYHYDLEDPATYQTKNNRLMYYEVFEDSQPAERLDYAYEVGDDPAAGNVVTTVRKATDDPLYYGTGFTYNKSGELWIVTQKTWELAGEEVVNEQTTDITEFRGIGRRRYMSRQRDVDTLLPIPETATWHDYDGNTIYADYTVDGSGDPIETTGYLPGLGQTDQVAGETAYYHTDQIGTTRLLTDDVSVVGLDQAYTAFGEPISATGPSAGRYGYAGAHGYQAHGTFSFLHLGHRYYEPTAGRFLQRDPTGLGGGTNAYVYVHNSPLRYVDPTGRVYEKTPGGIYVPRWLTPIRGVRPWWSIRPGFWSPAGLCFSVGYVVVKDHIVPAIDRNTAIREWDGYNTLRRPFDPDNPWGWTDADFVPDYIGPPKPPRPSPPSTPSPADPDACFVTGTLVWTADGMKPIEEIVSGDWVFSWDFQEGRAVLGQVTATLHGSEHGIVDIQTPGDTIRCSAEHKFWADGMGWVSARDLAVDVHLRKSGGGTVLILNSSGSNHANRVRTHNLQVEPNYNYFVGRECLLVHNWNFYK